MLLRKRSHNKNITMRILIISLLAAIVLGSCIPESRTADPDPLPSWNDTPTRKAILDFVSQTTTPGSPSFIPEAERIVVFDNDGTLWSEKPLYFQFEFAMDMIRTQAGEHPDWRDEQPFKAVLENDMKALLASGEEGILKMLIATHTGMANEAFKKTVAGWIDTARHDQTGMLYKEMVFQPMLEVLDYFQANGFRTYIVSGGSVGFMQAWAEELYGIPTEQLIGSQFKLEFDGQSANPVLMRAPEFVFFNDKENKPVSIAMIIGKRPVAAFGNSDGDLAMLQYTSAGEGKRLMVYIHHTDAEREYAYDRESSVGRLDKGLDMAAVNGWTVVDMKNDWKSIYPE